MKKAQIITVLLAIGVTVFIFLKGKNEPAVLAEKDRSLQVDEEVETLTAFDMRAYIDRVKASLTADAETKIDAKEAALAADDAPENFKALIAEWTERRQPAISAFYSEKYADAYEDADAWMQAGDAYFEAYEKVPDSSMRRFMVAKSLAAYDEALQLEPGNLDAKVQKAITVIEGKRQIMAGVTILKEVETEDPNHPKALLYLGLLSIQSNQYDKAVERFEKLVDLGLAAENPFHHYYLAISYQGLGELEAALENVEIFEEKVQDEALKKQAAQMKANILQQL